MCGIAYFAAHTSAGGPASRSLPSCLRSDSTTRAPSRANLVHSARPMPLAPPVTTHTLSLTCMAGPFGCGGRSGVDLEVAVGLLEQVAVQGLGRGAVEHGAGGDVEPGAVALAHERRPELRADDHLVGVAGHAATVATAAAVRARERPGRCRSAASGAPCGARTHQRAVARTRFTAVHRARPRQLDARGRRPRRFWRLPAMERDGDGRCRV